MRTAHATRAVHDEVQYSYRVVSVWSIVLISKSPSARNAALRRRSENAPSKKDIKMRLWKLQSTLEKGPHAAATLMASSTLLDFRALFMRSCTALNSLSLIASARFAYATMTFQEDIF